MVSKVALLALLTLACVGCGGESTEVVEVAESPWDDPSGAASPVIAASRSPSRPPSAPAGSSRPIWGAGPSDPRPSPTGPVTWPLLVNVLPVGDFQPGVRLELSQPSVAPVVDMASPDGTGVHGKFSALKPGRYLLKVLTPTTPGRLLWEGPTDVDSDAHVDLQLACVLFRLPAKRAVEVDKAIRVTLTSVRQRVKVAEGTFEELQATGMAGEKHRGAVILPFGKYRYDLVDGSPDPTIGFRAQDGSNHDKKLPLVLTDNEFELTPEHPASAVDLTRIVRID